LFIEFPPVSMEEWEAAARSDLKGKDPGKVLYGPADAPPFESVQPWPLQPWEMLTSETYTSAEGDLVVDIGPSYFDEIAKLRALRRLHPEARIIARTTRSDAGGHDDLVRTTTEAMAAIIGGCDALIVSPFLDGDALAERLAVNTQHLLREESHFGEVADPAAGSWYIEALTREWMKRLA
jgi:hypothetical protein